MDEIAAAKKIQLLISQSKRIGKLKVDDVKKAELRTPIVNEVKFFLGCDWNYAIDWLDDFHPGWRGYEVRYPDGRIG